MRILNIFFLIAILSFQLTSCQSTKSSMLIADKYDEKENSTILTILPYGNIKIPKKWKKTKYNEVSRQHFFQSEDNKFIGIAKNPISKYPFYKENVSNTALVSEFVNWDLEYWKSKGMMTTILDDKSERGFILWHVSDAKSESKTIFLFGIKNNFAYNFSAELKNWDETEIKSFLISLYESN